MEEVIRLIQQNGIWVFLVGVITSIIIGIVKTPIRSKVIHEGLSEEQVKKRENLFDTIVFLSTYVLAFIGAIVYYTIVSKSFNFLEILSLSLPIWLSQSMSYGIWKKLGLKRLLQLLVKLVIRDANKDGKISLDEAIAQVKGAYKDGKLDVDKLLEDAAENAVEQFPEVIGEAGKEVEMTPDMEATLKAAEGDKTELVENIKDAANNLIKEAKEASKLADSIESPVVASTSEEVVIANNNNKIIKF